MGIISKLVDWAWVDSQSGEVWIIQKAVIPLIEIIVEGIFAIAFLLIKGAWTLASTAAAPNLNAEFLYTWVSRVFGISVPIMVLLLIAQIILGTVKFSLKEIGRAFLGMGYAIIGTICSLPIAGVLQAMFDGIADWTIHKTLIKFGTSGDGIAELLLGGNWDAWIIALGALTGMGFIIASVAAPLIFTMFSSAAMAATFGLFMALQIRTMLLYIILVIGPIMISGAVFSKTTQWATRYISMVLALIITKLGVVIVFSLGLDIIADMATSRSNQNLEGLQAFLAPIGQLSAGILMLALATIVPYACFKFFDFAGEHLVEGLSANVKAVTDRVGQKTKELSHATNLNPKNVASKLGIGGAAVAGAGAVIGATKAPVAAAGKDAVAVQATGSGGSRTAPSQAQAPGKQTSGQSAPSAPPTRSSGTQGQHQVGQTPSTPAPTQADQGASPHAPVPAPPPPAPSVGQAEPAPAPSAVENVNHPPAGPGTVINPAPQPGTIVNPSPLANNPHLAPASHTDSITDAVKNAVTGK